MINYIITFIPFKLQDGDNCATLYLAASDEEVGLNLTTDTKQAYVSANRHSLERTLNEMPKYVRDICDVKILIS